MWRSALLEPPAWSSLWFWLAVPLIGALVGVGVSTWVVNDRSESVITPALVPALAGLGAMWVQRIAWLASDPSLASVLWSLHGVELLVVAALTWLADRAVGTRSVAHALVYAVIPLAWIIGAFRILGPVVDVVDPGRYRRRP